MKVIKISSIIALALCTSLWACDNSSTTKGEPLPVTKADPESGCVPEADLMKAGIVGGQKVSDVDADSKKVVLLVGQVEGADGATICTASAIAPNIILTAAHCLSEKHVVVFHSSISCESGFDKRKHIVRAKFAFKNDNWNEETGIPKDDVAVVVLDGTIPNSYRVLKIADPDQVDMTNGNLQLLGYGNVDFKAGGSAILRKTSVPISKVQVSKNGNIVDIDQRDGHGVCSGDSGGPSLVKVNGEDQILGVNSIIMYSEGTAEGEACRSRARQTLANGHKEWIKTELAKRGINITL